MSVRLLVMRARVRAFVVPIVAVGGVFVLSAGTVVGAGPVAAIAPHWVAQTTPNPSGAVAPKFEAVACPSVMSCFGVGEYFKGNPTLPLAERWNGTAWALQSIPTPSNSATRLTGVACPSTMLCVAVGSNAPASFRSVPFAERWNGSTWSMQTVPSPNGGPSDHSSAGLSARVVPVDHDMRRCR